VQIEIDVQRWLPSFSIVWLWDASIQESKERIRSAIKNSGYQYPKERITCNLAPAHIKKTGSHFDLPISLWILLENSETPPEWYALSLEKTLIIWEVALSGEVRRVTWILPMVITALQSDWENIIIPFENLGEVHELCGINIIAVQAIHEAYSIILWQAHQKNHTVSPHSFETSKEIIPNQEHVLLESIQWQETAKRALIISAAGWHNILLEGPPWCGKSMLANALFWILPPMTQEERLEIAQIYSVVGGLENISQVHRPFRKIHPSATYTSIFGWWSLAKPGEISLAHNGVLFFDEFLECNKRTIEGLREPLESKQITILRANAKYTYPANFMLVWAMNPCPCWYMQDSHKTCIDTKKDIENYRSKLSWPILDRIDIHMRIWRAKPGIYTNSVLTTNNAQKQVTLARKKSLDRQWKINSQLTPWEVETLEIEEGAKNILLLATETLGLSMRSYHRILRISQTIADLENTNFITENHMAEAMWYRL
jgi:magnesium chelatase family protein